MNGKDTKDHVIQVRVTQSQRELIEKLAAESGQKVSQYVLHQSLSPILKGLKIKV